ncbi:hypothetical protein RYX36_001974, partial [Vicia faba]
ADTIGIVNSFANKKIVFLENFKKSMIKMGNIGVLTRKKGADTIGIVNTFSNNKIVFLENLKKSMIKMGNIGVLTRKK